MEALASSRAASPATSAPPSSTRCAGRGCSIAARDSPHTPPPRPPLPTPARPAAGRFEVTGPEPELRERAVAGWSDFEGHSPHRPWVDAVKIACAGCGATVERPKEVGTPRLDTRTGP